ncbi:hypothetical protein [Clostridium sp. CF012]|uniref:hypothetical protein n=1 Tax=Clostridium sp. CF012 TaxID=2843319 RepID=UPI001C0D1514|nr:hypothetical protein [Clostridium sp. CF012]MBU3142231.1 hypothetical protein [Clostridium sp. CF012]
MVDNKEKIVILNIDGKLIKGEGNPVKVVKLTKKELEKKKKAKFNYANCNILNLEASTIHKENGNNNIIIKKTKKYEGSFDNSKEMQTLNKIYSKLKSGEEKSMFYPDAKGNKRTGLIINLNFSTTSTKKKLSVTGEEIIDEYGEEILVTDLKIKELREDLYIKGFTAEINGVTRKYKKYKRSTGSARQGACIFIWEDLYDKAMLATNMGVDINKVTKVYAERKIPFDLPGYESYISLPMSSAIDSIQIPNNSIMVVDDQYSIFTREVMETKIIPTFINGNIVKDSEGKDVSELHTDINKQFEVKNNLWDGMSLLDESVFGEKYKTKGFLLVRNDWCKSACFNTRIQAWFEENKIYTIEQLRKLCPSMVTLAKEINQIKMITTRSSFKMAKFPLIMDTKKYLKKLDNKFYIVKYEKPTKFWNGDYVKTSYQLCQTVNMNTEELESFLKPTVDYIKELKNDNNIAFRNHLKMRIGNNIEEEEITSNDEMILNMLAKSNKFTETEIFKDFKIEVIGNLKTEAKTGRVMVKGTYATMVSCPILMLKYAIGEWKEGMPDVINPGDVVCTNFNIGDEVAMVRSPHICSGNLLTSKVVENKLITEYMNLSPNIVLVSSIDNNIQQILNGCDWDSDTCLTTTSKEILSSIERNKGSFLVPCTEIEGEKSKYTYCLKDMATMDSIASNSQKLIGQIVNLSANLNSLMFHNINEGKSIKSQEPLYKQICSLAIMSGLAIDGSKKTFSVDLIKELIKIRKNWSDKFDYEITKDEETISKKSSYIPNFFRWIKTDKVDSRRWRKYNSTMDNISNIIKDSVRGKGNGKMSQLYQLLDTSNIEGRLDKVKKDKFVSDLKELSEACKKIFKKQTKRENEDFTKITQDEKYEKMNALNEEFIKQHMNCLNEKTIEAIILEEGHTTEYDSVKRKLINMLFLTHKSKFKGIFKTTTEIEDIKYLVRLDTVKDVEELEYKDTDIIELYGIKHFVISSNRELNVLNTNAKITNISDLIIKSVDKQTTKLKNAI